MHGAPGLGALDQTGSRQHVEMLDHRRQRHVEPSGDLRHRQLAAVCEPVEDRAPRRISQRGKRAIELDIAKVNHMVIYRFARCGRQDGKLHNRVHEATGGSLGALSDHVGLEVDQLGNAVTKSFRAVPRPTRVPIQPRARKPCSNALKTGWTGQTYRDIYSWGIGRDIGQVTES